jgi:putative flavoprotein involved in K+ transport
MAVVRDVANWKSMKVLILGAGPAGLTLASELKQRAVDCLLLEKASTVADSWVRMPSHLKLVSPWKANWLPSADPRRFPPNHALSAAEYGSWLQQYARLRELPVVTNAGVRAVSRAGDGGFVVQTAAGTFTAPLIVNATGCFANPFVPEAPGARESSIPQLHFATFRDAEHLRGVIGHPGGSVLIVGKRLSAGQALVELADAGFDVAISCRAPIQFGSGPIGWWVFFRIHPALERLKLKLHGNAARGFEVRMPGGRARQLIANGRVKVFPEIARFEDRSVIFSDGQSLRPGAVLYATGFRPALAHLASLGIAFDERTGQPALRGFESAQAPGLFFLGLDGLRNFRSRFLRGIREDAPLLAEELAKRTCSRTANSCNLIATVNPQADVAATVRPQESVAATVRSRADLTSQKPSPSTTHMEESVRSPATSQSKLL